MADITMPQLGETVTEGTITKWLKQVGDKVEEDEVLFEVSTDKVDSEVPSPSAGYLAEILVEEGETVDVGAKLAVISSDAPSGDGDSGAEKKDAAEEEAEDESADTAEEPEDQPEEGPAAQSAEDEEGDAAAEADGDAAAEATEAEAGGATEAEASAEAGDDVTDEEQQEAKADEKAATQRAPSGRRPADSRPAGRPDGGGTSAKVLSPVVRRLIAEHDLDPEQIEGTGAGGRITRDDVLRVIDTGKTKAPADKKDEKRDEEEKAPPSEKPAAKEAPAEKRAGPERAAPMPAAKAGERDEVVAFTNIRRRTAEHMVRSQATSAHTLVAVEVDYDNVDRVRNKVKGRFKDEEGFSLSYLPFIARAVIDAIHEFPHVNSSVGNDELIVHKYVNLGIAVDLDFQGLIVPVVRDAETKRLRALAREIADLAQRARAKKLSADDISGGTFTITNAGGYGTLLTGPVINQPQVAILSTDGVKMKPVAVELPDGGYAVAVHPVGNLAETWDHRAYDGAYAAAFLSKVREILETRDWSQEL